MHRAILIISICLLESGCSTVPAHFDVPYSDTGVPLANSIDQRIRCELIELVRDDIYPVYNRRATLLLYDYHAAMLLSLDANDTGSLTPSLSFPSTGFTFNLTPSAKLSRQDQINYTFNFSLLDMYRDWKLSPSDYTCPDSDTNLAGNLGLREKISSALNLPDVAYTTEAKSTDGEFSGVINFTATKSINQAGPTWTLTHFVGPGALAAASEVNTDKLTFGFAAGPKVKVLTDMRPAAQRATTAGEAERALGRAFENDFGTQLNAIRSLLP